MTAKNACAALISELIPSVVVPILQHHPTNPRVRGSKGRAKVVTCEKSLYKLVWKEVFTPWLTIRGRGVSTLIRNYVRN